MEKNFNSISPERMKALASSPAARALMEMLRQEHGAAVENVLKSAKGGDMTRLQQSLGAVMADPKAQELIRRLQEEQNG